MKKKVLCIYVYHVAYVYIGLCTSFNWWLTTSEIFGQRTFPRTKLSDVSFHGTSVPRENEHSKKWPTFSWKQSSSRKSSPYRFYIIGTKSQP